MNNRLEVAQDRFIGSIGKLCASFGLNGLVAQLYAILYLHDEPLSLDDMCGKLKVSKGSVSLNIRELERWGAVKNIWVKGSRKDYYIADPDVKKVVVNKIRNGIQKRLTEVSSMVYEFDSIMKSADGEFTEEEKKLVKGYGEKLKKIEELKALAATALTLADNLL